MWQLAAYLVAYFSFQGAPVPEAGTNLTYAYYLVEAEASQPLLPQLIAASPNKLGEVVYVGHSAWSVRWRYDWKVDEQGDCSIKDAVTSLDVVITLPELKGGSERQREAFNRYVGALRRHELNHYRIARDAARKIDADLKRSPTMKSCQALETYVNLMAQCTLDRFEKKSRQYDRDTNHGQTEGAWMDI